MNMCPVGNLMDLMIEHGKDAGNDMFLFSLEGNCIFTDSSIIYRVQEFLLDVDDIPRVEINDDKGITTDNFKEVNGFYLGIEYDSVVVVSGDSLGSVPLKYWNVMRSYYGYGEIQ